MENNNESVSITDTMGNVVNQKSNHKQPIDETDASNMQRIPSTYLNPLHGQFPNIEDHPPMAKKPNINQPNWRFTSNPGVASGPSLNHTRVLPGRISPRKVRRPSRGETNDGIVTRQPGNTAAGVVRATEMLRNLNNHGDVTRRGSESEEERTSRSVSRRSSGGDSGVGNLSEGEFLEHDNKENGKNNIWYTII